VFKILNGLVLNIAEKLLAGFKYQSINQSIYNGYRQHIFLLQIKHQQHTMHENATDVQSLHVQRVL
jgi:hypothetical protein